MNTEMNNIVKLAVDSYHGRVEKYSKDDTQEALRNALVELNGGNTKLDYRAIRDGKANGIFALVETILSKTVYEDVSNDELIKSLVEFRNVAEGDLNVFNVDNSNLFVVDEVANGTQAIRRQRITNNAEVSIPTTMKMVRIYEELNRILSGRVDFNVLIDKVAQSFKRRLADDIFTLWANTTAEDLGGVEYFPVAGTFNADDLLDVISHVEAAAGGKTATIIGTKKALRQLSTLITYPEGQRDINENGYVGKFYGSNVIALPQRHKVGTNEFLLDDTVITIVAGDDKPIKVVYEGESIMLMGDPMTNMDLTQEYLYGEKYGVGMVIAGGNAGIGRYQTTA